MLDPVAEAVQRLILDHSAGPYAEFEAAARRVEDEFVAREHSARLQREIRRRITELLLTQACADNAPEQKILALTYEMDELGYSTVERRAHIACMFARWAVKHPAYKLRARALLSAAKRRGSALRRTSSVRRQVLASLESCLSALRLKEGPR